MSAGCLRRRDEQSSSRYLTPSLPTNWPDLQLPALHWHDKTMAQQGLLLASILAVQFAGSAVASPGHAREHDICSTGIYKEFVPLLKTYPVAQQYCSEQYYVPCTTASASQSQRPWPSKLSAALMRGSGRFYPKEFGEASSAWTKCRGHKDPSVMPNVCHCIQEPKVRAYPW